MIQIEYGFGIYVKFWEFADTDSNFKLTLDEYQKALKDPEWKRVAENWEDKDQKEMKDWIKSDESGELEMEEFFRKIRQGI